MSDARQETVADIVREMRIGDLCAGDTTSARPEYINDFLASYADRIEAAWKREQEATTEKSLVVGNAATVRGIAQGMLNTSMQDITAEVVYGWASRLADACEQTVTDCNQLGNAAAMREALKEIRARLVYLYGRIDGTFYPPALKQVYEIASTALSAPPRNCDRFSNANDALRAFENDENAKSSYWGMDGWLFAEAKGETK